MLVITHLTGTGHQVAILWMAFLIDLSAIHCLRINALTPAGGPITIIIIITITYQNIQSS
jgi:hypothetical protein